MTPMQIAIAIKALSLEDLVELKRLLGDEWWDEGGAGVREPVGPAPESPGDAIAQDYWESAE